MCITVQIFWWKWWDLNPHKPFGFQFLRLVRLSQLRHASILNIASRHTIPMLPYPGGLSHSWHVRCLLSFWQYLVGVKRFELLIVSGLNRLRMPIPPHSDIGASYRIRTYNLRLRRTLRYPLRQACILVGRVGFEPTVYQTSLFYRQVPSPAMHTDPYSFCWSSGPESDWHTPLTRRGLYH